MTSSIARRVASRYLQALILPPRQLVSFMAKFEKALMVALDDTDKSAGDLAQEASEKDQAYEVKTILKSLDLPMLTSIQSALKGHLKDLDFSFDTFRRMAPKNPRITDSVASNVVAQIKQTFDESTSRGMSIRALAEALDPSKVKRALEDNDLAWSEKYEEGLRPEIVAKLHQLGETAKACVTLVDSTLPRIEAFSTGDVKPEKMETLYHASVKARDIYSHGFQAEMPKDQLGLGGSQEGSNGVKGISFTYDLKAALDIARSFKEAAMIATGEIKASDILDWGAHDIDLQEFLMWIKIKVDKRAWDFTHDGHRWILKVRELGGETVEKDIDEVLDKPMDVFNVYDAFLFAHPSRLNPVHMNRFALLTYLKDADPKDIGVVSAEVDMTHPGIAAKGGEREFRVPPAAVLKVTRFYS